MITRIYPKPAVPVLSSSTEGGACPNAEQDWLSLEGNWDERKVQNFLDLSRGTVRNKNDEASPYHDPSFPKPMPMRGEARKGSALRYRKRDVINWNRKCFGLPPLVETLCPGGQD